MVLSAILGQTLSITWLILGFTISAVSWRFALGKLSTASQSTNVNEHKADVLNMRPRIEPSFGKLDRAPLLEIQNSEQLTQETNEGKQNFHQTDANKSYKSSTDELYKTWQTYKENLVIYLKRHPKLIVLAIFGVTSILLATTVINSHKKTKNIIPPALSQQLVEIKPIPVEQQSKLDFKGDFSLGMVDRQPVISWQQKSIIQGDKWSLATAKGDTSCSELIFNNGDKLRPMKVIAVDGNTYQAWFSPLDSEKLIQNLAALSNAKLCGHKFPLTGTLRILSKTQPYADYL